MGCVGLPTPAAMEGVWAAGVVGVMVGDPVEVAARVTGVVGAWVELIRAADPEEGVAAADWLRELQKDRKTIIHEQLYHQLELSSFLGFQTDRITRLVK